MTKARFDQEFWEELWSKTLRERADTVAHRPPNAHLMAEAAGADVAERIAWIEGDLATWTAQPGHYDLEISVYVHAAGSVEEMIRSMASSVAPGGTLFLLGHRPIDPGTGVDAVVRARRRGEPR